MYAIKKYFTGPVTLSVLVGAFVCTLAYVDKEITDLTALLVLLCGLVSIGSAIWGGIKSIGDRSNVLRAIGPKVLHIITFSSDQFRSFAISANEISLQGESLPSEEQVRLVFSKLDPRGRSTVSSVQTGSTLNWLEYMCQYNTRTRDLVTFIYQFMPFLDPELVKILGELEDCDHFKEIELLANGPGAGNSNLEFSALGFRQYQKIVNELSEYFDKELVKHTKNTPAMAVQPIIG